MSRKPYKLRSIFPSKVKLCCLCLCQQNESLHVHYFTLPKTLHFTTLTKSEIKHPNTYLVFSIFKNCKISENCINLKALKNLKPVRKKKKTIKTLPHMIYTNSDNINSIRLWYRRTSYLSYSHPCLSASLDSY